MAADDTPQEIIARLRVLEVLVEQKFSAQEKAVTTALAVNEKRLDILNENRGSLSDLSNLMMTRTEGNAAHKALSERLDSETSVMRTRMDAYGRPNYVLAITGLSMGVGLLSGIWVVIGLKIDNSIAPISVQTEQLRYSQTTQDQRITANTEALRLVRNDISLGESALAQSVIDRARLNEKIHDLDQALTSGRVERQRVTSEIQIALARINVWLEFIQVKVYPGKSAPPLKQ